MVIGVRGARRISKEHQIETLGGKTLNNALAIATANRYRWTGSWTLDEKIEDVSIFKLRFSDTGHGTLSVKNEQTGFLCSTFYSKFSQSPDSTAFEFTFARGRMEGEFIIDSSRKMRLTVKDCSLPQIPMSRGSLQWTMVRCG